MSPENEIHCSEAACQTMIENMYREMLPLAWQGRKAEAEGLIGELDFRSKKIAGMMSEADAIEFVARFEKMRNVVADSLEQDRAAFLQRIGLVDPNDRRRQSSRMPLGELAVRTAVRTTVWDSVRAIFRIFR